MREIVETRSILGTRIRQWMTGTTERLNLRQIHTENVFGPPPG